MIHDEWTRSVLADRPDLKPVQLARTRPLMDSHVRGALVSGHESLIPTLTLPDPDDRHVLAAAIRAGADAIVTFNLADFPDEALAPYRVLELHPDAFVAQPLDEAAERVRVDAGRQRASLKNPPKSAEEYLAILGRVGLPRSASRLRVYSDLL
jgi:hypothetical protein